MDRILKSNSINILTGPNLSGKTTLLKKVNDNPEKYFENSFLIQYFFSIDTKSIFMENKPGGEIVKVNRMKNSDSKVIKGDFNDIDFNININSINDKHIEIIDSNGQIKIPSTGIDKSLHFEYILSDVKEKALKHFYNQIKSLENFELVAGNLKLIDFDLKRYIKFLNYLENVDIFMSDKYDPGDFSSGEILDILYNEENFDFDFEELYQELSFWLSTFEDLNLVTEQKYVDQKYIDLIMKYFDFTNHNFLWYVKECFKSDLKITFWKTIIDRIEINLNTDSDLNELSKRLGDFAVEFPFDMKSFEFLFIIDELENSLDRKRLSEICSKIVDFSSNSDFIKATYLISTHSIDVVKNLGYQNLNLYYPIMNDDSLNFKEVNFEEDAMEIKKIIFWKNNIDIFFNRKIIIVEGYTDLMFFESLKLNRKIDFHGFYTIYVDGLKNISKISKFIINNIEIFDEVLILIDEDIKKEYVNTLNKYNNNPYFVNINSLGGSENNRSIALNEAYEMIKEVKNITIVTHLYKGIENLLSNDSNMEIEKFDAYDLQKTLEIIDNLSWEKEKSIWELLYVKVGKEVKSEHSNNFIETEFNGFVYSFFKHWQKNSPKKVFGPYKK